jgi:hypothetical protein
LPLPATVPAEPACAVDPLCPAPGGPSSGTLHWSSVHAPLTTAPNAKRQYFMSCFPALPDSGGGARRPGPTEFTRRALQAWLPSHPGAFEFNPSPHAQRRREHNHRVLIQSRCVM